MGVASLARAVEEFRAAGRPGSTPVAVIHRAYQPGQRVVTGTLADIVDQVASAGVDNPSVIVIGDVVDVVPQLRRRRTHGPPRDRRHPAHARQPRRTRAAAAEGFARAVEARAPALRVHVAALDHGRSLTDVCLSLSASGVEHATVVPAFVSAAHHVRVDVPAAVALAGTAPPRSCAPPRRSA